MTPCSDDSQFAPANIQHSWCDFRGTFPDPADCTAAGCHTWENEDTTGCHCDEKAACEGFDAFWGERTCGEEALHWDEGGKNLRAAEEAGTCENAKTSWGQDLKQAIDWPAKKCCTNYPATACDKTAKIMTPCKDDADFMEDVVLHSWCDFNRVDPKPSEEACTAARCHFWEHENHLGEMESGCHCEGSAKCAALGGAFHETTCGKEVREHWGSDMRSLLQSAEEAGTCEDVKTPWGEDVTRWLRWPATKCCKSYPKTVCDKTAKVVTPCASEADFEPAAIANKWCDYHGNEPDSVTCEKKGFCHCHRKDSCQFFNGTWKEETCKDKFNHWDEGGKGLKEAEEKGTCEGVTTSWGGSVKDEIDWPAKWCCKNYPATACVAGTEA
mmetsp:Transcript_105940/g.236496  ORF Transcript_105940/g.236496 Transcript_105940/m.236496 type:complete len:384 (+) Transcript_105940:3-1154(+)